LNNNPYYNQNYTREQINAVLNTIKQCVEANRYTISLGTNRQENQDLIDEYNIREEKQKEILMNISVDDFCHTLRNTKLGFEHEILYVFVPQVELYNTLDEKETVDIYTKFNVLELPKGKKAIVISFHKLNRPIDYAFR